MNFNGNDFKPGHIVLALTGIIALLLLFPALAELDRSVWQRDYNKILPAIRIWMIVGSSLAGFALGWFLSPQASELRAIVGATVAGLAIFVATFNNDALGCALPAERGKTAVWRLCHPAIAHAFSGQSACAGQPVALGF